jgi:(1->4)-alpha-D-glucan 1-alpha-D-glucosylmutase
VAFTRNNGLVVVVPRLVPDVAEGWAGTTVDLPTDPWVDVLTGAPVDGGRAEVADLLRRFPVAVLGRNV